MKPYWSSLDGLRAFAVLIVLLSHAGVPLVHAGNIGVDVFFVLSGFLITGILSREYQTHARISLRNFYARRFLRLAPCLFLTCLVAATVTKTFYNFVPYDRLTIAMTYTANWAKALFDYNLGNLVHCWSLAIEEQYYLVWPLVVIALERSRLSSRGKCGTLLLIALLLALYRYAVVGTYSATRIYYGLDTHADGLVLGSALSYLVQSFGGCAPPGCSPTSPRRLPPRPSSFSYITATGETRGLVSSGSRSPRALPQCWSSTSRQTPGVC